MYDVLNTKQELNSYGVIKRPLNFYYTVSESDKRGYNKMVTVYVLTKEGEPFRLGYNHYHTASCRGESTEVRHMIREVYGYKLKDGYKFINTNINTHEML